MTETAHIRWVRRCAYLRRLERYQCDRLARIHGGCFAGYEEPTEDLDKGPLSPVERRGITRAMLRNLDRLESTVIDTARELDDARRGLDVTAFTTTLVDVTKGGA